MDIKCIVCFHLQKIHWSNHLPSTEFDVTAEDSTTFFQVRRKHIWKDSLHAFKQRRFTPRKRLKIEFIGESAIEEGWPRREYFHLGMQELHQNNALFQVALGKRIPSHNLHCLATRSTLWCPSYREDPVCNSSLQLLPITYCKAMRVYSQKFQKSQIMKIGLKSKTQKQINTWSIQIHSNPNVMS